MRKYVYFYCNKWFSFFKCGLILEFKMTQKCEAFLRFQEQQSRFHKKISLLCFSGKATYFRFLGHLSNSGDHLIWVGVRRASCVYIFFSRTTEPILTKSGMQHLYGKETKNCKFHDPPNPSGGKFGVKSVKLMYFFQNLLLSV